MKRISVLLLLILLLSACAAPAPQAEAPGRSSAVGFYFDTVITITAYGAEQSVLNEAVALCGEYEALLSRTREGSDVWNINHANGVPVAVSAHTAAILKEAIRIGEGSGGAFDVTIAPASLLWDFTEPVLPEEEALARAAELVDYRNIAIEGDRVTLPAGMMIDLGGIAKGYAADQIAAHLRARGVGSALLDFGGNVAAIGSKPDGSPWTIGVQDPFSGRGASIHVVSLADGSAVTSGIYERGFDLGGVRYHHILDPDTGWPVDNGLASVTILAESSMTADALSTACFVLGPEKGMALAEEMGVEAVFVTKEGEVWEIQHAAWK